MTAMALAGAEAQVQCLAQCSGLMDLALPRVAQIRSLGWKLSYAADEVIKKKREREKELLIISSIQHIPGMLLTHLIFIASVDKLDDDNADGLTFYI